jgi:hypothetical protein
MGHGRWAATMGHGTLTERTGWGWEGGWEWGWGFAGGRAGLE